MFFYTYYLYGYRFQNPSLNLIIRRIIVLFYTVKKETKENNWMKDSWSLDFFIMEALPLVKTQ